MDLFLFFRYDEQGNAAAAQFVEQQVFRQSTCFENLRVLLADTQREARAWKFAIRDIISNSSHAVNPALSESEIWEKLKVDGLRTIERIEKVLRKIAFELGQNGEMAFELSEHKTATNEALGYCNELKERLQNGDFKAYRVWDFVNGKYLQREQFRVVGKKISFEGLFETDETMKKALAAALQVGIIDDANNWKLDQRGKKGIGVVLDYWFAISHEDFGLTKIRPTDGDKFETIVLPCQAICRKFNTKTIISDSTVYEHIPKSRGKYYRTTLRALTGITGNSG